MANTATHTKYTKYSYAMFEGTGLFVYTSRERRDEACADCNCGELKPIPAVKARTHMREALIRELWATPDDFRVSGRLVHQDAITEYYMQMVAQLG